MHIKALVSASLAVLTLSVAAAPALAVDTAPAAHKGHRVWVCKNPKKAATNGAILGAVGGAVVGDLLAPKGSKTAGAVVGAGVGGLAGHQMAKTHEKHKCHWEYH